VHGESRDRGQAMVDLMGMYEADGFELDAKELPDYLPMFLEYLSMKPEQEARELLGQTGHIITALKERLRKRKSVYLNAFIALEAMAKGKPDADLLKQLLAQPEDDPLDLEALDEIWEEEVVTFGGNTGENACGPDRLQRQIRAHQRRPAAPSTGQSM
jgi:nitrate reductase delta subunit